MIKGITAILVFFVTTLLLVSIEAGIEMIPIIGPIMHSIMYFPTDKRWGLLVTNNIVPVGTMFAFLERIKGGKASAITAGVISSILFLLAAIGAIIGQRPIDYIIIMCLGIISSLFFMFEYIQAAPKTTSEKTSQNHISPQRIVLIIVVIFALSTYGILGYFLYKSSNQLRIAQEQYLEVSSKMTKLQEELSTEQKNNQDLSEQLEYTERSLNYQLEKYQDIYDSLTNNYVLLKGNTDFSAGQYVVVMRNGSRETIPLNINATGNYIISVTSDEKHSWYKLENDRYGRPEITFYATRGSGTDVYRFSNNITTGQFVIVVIVM